MIVQNISALVQRFFQEYHGEIDKHTENLISGKGLCYRFTTELRWWASLFHFFNPGTLTPIGIFTMADGRECTDHQRAIANMSAIGATRWYEDAIRNGCPVPSLELVLQRCPLAFVREVCRQWPGDFFGSFGKWDANTDFLTAVSYDRISKGSMLPFSADKTRFSQNIVNSRFLVDHPSLPDWEILCDGSVAITRASVLVSPEMSTQRPQRRTECGFHDMFKHGGLSKATYTAQKTVLFDDFVCEMITKQCRRVYVIMVEHEAAVGRWFWGILLQDLTDEIKSEAIPQGRKILVKTGVCAGQVLSAIPWPETESVDWVVW